jgi:hypothetical protein
MRVFETSTSFGALGIGTVTPARASTRKGIPTGIAASAAEQLIASAADCFRNSGEAD